MTNTSARMLTVAALVIIVLGATYAIHKRNMNAVADNTTTTSTVEPAAGPAGGMTSATMPGVAPGSPFDVSNSMATSGTTGAMMPAANPDVGSNMAPANPMNGTTTNSGQTSQ